MKIIAHRGFWLRGYEQNKINAFLRSLDYGFGVEFDVRDCGGDVVVSHEPLCNKANKFSDIFKILSRHRNFSRVVFAINIKSDGMEAKIYNLIAKFGMKKNSFVFDMSVPVMFNFYYSYRRKINMATRHSDVERYPVLYDSSRWVWMDELSKRWISSKAIVQHLRNKKLVCVVSPELHSRNYIGTWKRYRSLSERYQNEICICTDYPDKANIFFNQK